MTKLSVNVNKVATLRNARGGRTPSLIDAVRVCIEAGAPGITIHPREDERHIRSSDVDELTAYLAAHRASVEFNIEGDPRPALMDKVVAVRPHQCTLVPVRPGEITSEAGWPASTDVASLRGITDRLRDAGIRVSVFVDPTRAAIDWAAEVGADRVELYTEPYAVAFGGPTQAERIEVYAVAARHAKDMGLGVNAGHDLDLENLSAFLGGVPGVDEVSIGHALMSRALFEGLRPTVSAYLELIRRVPG